MTTIALNTLSTMPAVGLGVFKTSPESAYSAVRHALSVGYRHIDTARIYGNESAVGEAVRDSGVPRDQVFVTTKLWNDDQAEGRVEQGFEESVRRLGLGPPDLFLLHWPVPKLRLSAWKALEQLYLEQQVRAIGVSNFMQTHLQELIAVAKVIPAVNQIEVSPFLQQKELQALCTRHGIAVAAYSPLTKGTRLNHPVVTAIADRLGKSNAQVLLRWGLQQGIAVLPKSVTPERIEQNLDVFDFSLDVRAMAELDALEENLVTGWNPQSV